MSASPTGEVDAFRYVDRITRTMMKAHIAREPVGSIPWTPLDRPLSECKIGLISTAGISLREGQRPFDAERERRDPWWGDPTHRELPWSATAADVRCDHLHIERSGVEDDLGCVVPTRGLERLVDEGVIGAVAPSWFCMMGYILRPQDELVPVTIPRIVAGLTSQEVDVALLVPV